MKDRSPHHRRARGPALRVSPMVIPHGAALLLIEVEGLCSELDGRNLR